MPRSLKNYLCFAIADNLSEPNNSVTSHQAIETNRVLQFGVHDQDTAQQTGRPLVDVPAAAGNLHHSYEIENLEHTISALLTIATLGRFECTSHHINCPAALWTNVSLFVIQLKTFLTVETGMST